MTSKPVWPKIRLGLIAALLVAAGCATVPLTGRSQVVILPDSQLAAMAFTEYQRVVAESTLSDDPRKVNMVRMVGLRLSVAAEQWLTQNGQSVEGYDWEFNVIEEDTINAWCMPGGKVAFYTGMFKVARTDTDIAVVMGHEIAHAIARHGNERMSQAILFQIGAVSLAYAVREEPSETQAIFLAAYGIGGQLGVLLPYSRLHEREADRIGLTIMAYAGYDPSAAIPFWQRMAAEGGARPPEFLSTHPAPQTRIDELRAFMPEAMAVYERNR